MTKRNPYRVIERIGSVTGTTLAIIIVVGAVMLFLVVLWDSFGWWSFLGIPIFFAGMLLIGLGHAAYYAIRLWWRDRKYDWDDEQRRKPGIYESGSDVVVGSQFGKPFNLTSYALNRAMEGESSHLRQDAYGNWIDLTDDTLCGLINPRTSWACGKPTGHGGDQHATLGPDGGLYDWFIEA